MPECIHRINPVGGLIADHSSHCAYPHRDGEIDIKTPATAHAHFNISKDRPNGTGCKNICDWHSKHFLDPDGKQRPQAGRIFISGEPIIDSNADSMPVTTSNWKPPASAVNGDSETINHQPKEQTDVKKIIKKKTTTTAKAKTGKAKTNGQVADLNDADVKFLATYQDKKIGGVVTIERMTANAMVTIFKTIKGATKTKPVVHADLSAYDKRLARELVRLGIVTKDNLGKVGLAYFPK